MNSFSPECLVGEGSLGMRYGKVETHARTLRLKVQRPVLQRSCLLFRWQLTAPHTTGLVSNVLMEAMWSAHQIIYVAHEVFTASIITLISSRRRGISTSLANMNLLKR